MTEDRQKDDLLTRAPEIAAAIEEFGQAARYESFSNATSARANLEALILAALPSPQVCVACGQPWTGEKCGQAENGWPFLVCSPIAALPSPSPVGENTVAWDQRPAHPLSAWKTGLPLGLHRIYWKSGGTSIAAIGMLSDGRRWIAPCNWVSPSIEPTSGSWVEIDRTDLLVPYPEPSDPAPDATASAVEAEREAIAQLVEQFTDAAHIHYDLQSGFFPKRSEVQAVIAAAIRARQPKAEAK